MPSNHKVSDKFLWVRQPTTHISFLCCFFSFLFARSFDDYVYKSQAKMINLRFWLKSSWLLFFFLSLIQAERSSVFFPHFAWRACDKYFAQRIALTNIAKHTHTVNHTWCWHCSHLYLALDRAKYSTSFSFDECLCHVITFVHHNTIRRYLRQWFRFS